MTDIPIIFSAPMIRALIEGRKTQTRRLAWTWRKPSISFPEGRKAATSWQNVKPGDRLWARETFSGERCWQDIPPSGWGWDTMQRPTEFWYWADGNPSDGEWTRPVPSIHMPRWASRLTLIVAATKIEPLQAISEADAKAEGCGLYVPGHGFIEPHELAEGYSNYLAPRMGFEEIWNILHGADSWQSNPEVVALTFRVIKANIDAPEAKAA